MQTHFVPLVLVGVLLAGNHFLAKKPGLMRVVLRIVFE